MIESQYMTEAKQDYITALQRVYSEGVYPDYPPHEDRLFLQENEVTYNQIGRLVVPMGLWDLEDAPDKSHAGELPTAQEQEQFILQNLQLDDRGRPLHPYATDLLTNHRLGALCNRGYYRRWGPNYTVDTVVLTENDTKVLLIQRGDTGAWALPGGFVDPGERQSVAAAREVFEETGVNLDIDAFTQITNKLPVADPRTTLHAWPETTCYSTTVPHELPVLTSEETPAVKWEYVDVALNGLLVASHMPLLKAALI